MQRLKRQFADLPRSVRRKVGDAVEASTEETAKVARILVPVKTGELKSWIRTHYESERLYGEVLAAPKGDRKAHAKARSVEFGRKKGTKGETTPRRYVRRAEAYIAKKFRSRISRAISQGVKEAMIRG
jgi:hypothetical protein